MNTQIDQEIARFNTLAEVWWDAEGPMWPLHKLNAIRVPYIKRAMKQHFAKRLEPNFSSMTVLDIGCGAGLLSEAMAKLGAQVTGVDPAEKNIAIARAHARAANLSIEYLHGDISVVQQRQFDVVLNMEVVEHVDDLPAFMQACGAAVKPGGMQVVATLNRSLKSWLFAIIGAEYILRWLPRGTHDWRRFVKPREMYQLLAASQCKMQPAVGVSVNPFTKAYSLSASTAVNFMAVASKPINTKLSKTSNTSNGSNSEPSSFPNPEYSGSQPSSLECPNAQSTAVVGQNTETSSTT